MERIAWRAMVKEGSIEEYKRRHCRLPEEMKEALKEAGVRNYTIFADGNELFGYYECEKGAEFATKSQNESDAVARWNVYMSDILIWREEKVQPKLTEVFRFE